MASAAAMLASWLDVEIGLEEAERFVGLRNRARVAEPRTFSSRGLELLHGLRHPPARVAAVRVHLMIERYMDPGRECRPSSLPSLIRPIAPRDPVLQAAMMLLGLVDAPALLVTALLELAAQPETEARLRAEVDAVLAKVEVRAGDWLLACPYLLHRDERYWPEPERLVPERWTPEETARRPRYAFLTFGVSNRIRPGRQLVATLVEIALAVVLGRRHLELPAEPETVCWHARPGGGDLEADRPVLAVLGERAASRQQPLPV